MAPTVYEGFGLASLLEVQRRAVKMVPGSVLDTKRDCDTWTTYLPCYTYRQLRGDAIEIYKYLHGIYNINSLLFFCYCLLEILV